MLCHIVAYLIPITRFGMDPVVASMPAFSPAVLVSYAGNRTLAFPSDGAHSVRAPQFVIVAVVGLIANGLITYIIIRVLSRSCGIALTGVILIVPVMAYQLIRFRVFGGQVARNAG